MLRTVFLLCVLLLFGAVPVSAEEVRMHRVGFITYASATNRFNDIVKAEMARLGYREGVNVEYRAFSGERNADEMRRQAEALAAWKPDVILSMMTNADLAVRDVTKKTKIPIVFWSTDPVGSGFVESYRKPGTHFTGFSFEPGQMFQHIRFLKLALPKLSCIAHLYNPTYAPAPGVLRELEEAARHMAVPVKVYDTRTVEDFETSLAAMRKDGCEAVVIGPHELFNTNGNRLGPLLLKHGLASVGLQLSIVRAGGLASYGPPHDEGWAAMASVVDRILKGADPSKIPIQRRFKSVLTINLKAAKELGLALPPSLIDEADSVIE